MLTMHTLNYIEDVNFRVALSVWAKAVARASVLGEAQSVAVFVPASLAAF